MKKTGLLENIIVSISLHLGLAAGLSMALPDKINPPPNTVYELEIVKEPKKTTKDNIVQQEKPVLKENKKVKRKSLSINRRKRKQVVKQRKIKGQVKTNPLLKMRPGRPKNIYRLSSFLEDKLYTPDAKLPGSTKKKAKKSRYLVNQLPLVESRSELNRMAERNLPGGGSGESACNPYKKIHLNVLEKRIAHIYVDTSQSTTNSHVQTCAAGIALAALRRGYKVAITNFSDKSRYISPGKNKRKIIEGINYFQGEGTKVPKFIKINSKLPVDLIFVSDGEISGSKEDLNEYVNHIGSKNKGFLYQFTSCCNKQFPGSTFLFKHLNKKGYKMKKFHPCKNYLFDCVLNKDA